jgi:hypothetical protein
MSGIINNSSGVSESQLSTTGGASKVPQFASDGTLTTGTLLADASPGTFADLGAGNVIFPDARGYLWRTAEGSNLALAFYSDGHDVGGGELYFQARNRICFNWGGSSGDGGFQMGTAAARTKEWLYWRAKGTGTAGDTLRESMPLSYQGSSYNGGSPVNSWISVQYVPGAAGTTGSLNHHFYTGNTPTDSDGRLAGTNSFAMTESGISLPTGKTVTFADGGSIKHGPIFTKRATDQTFTQSSVTPQDTGIEAVLIAGVTYKIEIFTNWTFTSTEGCRLHLAYSGTLAPSGGTSWLTGGGTISNWNGISGTSGADGFNSDLTKTGVSTTQIGTCMIYTATTGGTLKLQGAQAVSGATNTVLKAGSYMIVTPL